MDTTNNIKILANPERYVSTELVLSCFEVGRIIHIDKQMCGNGFTTAFATLKPLPKQVNILIEVNKEVVKSKEEAYVSGSFGKGMNVVFRYRETKTPGLLFYDSNKEHVDLIVCVVDSFLLLRDSLLRYADKINLILIDEYHSIEKQSSFRPKLKNFLAKLNPFIEQGAKVATVSATPNLFSPIDIQIKNAHQPKISIHHSQNQKLALERIKNSLRSGFTTIVFTNDVHLLSRLKNPKDYKNPHELRARFHVGTQMMRNLAQRAIIAEDIRSRLVVVSSRGFDGFDILDENCHVYFFERRDHEHQTFYISNLYQALNRVRKGPSYVEYCRIDARTERQIPTEKQIYSFIEDDRYTVEEKQSTSVDKDFKKFHPYVFFERSAQNPKEWLIAANTAQMALAKETLEYDKGIDSPAFQKFHSDRKLTIIRVPESPNCLNPPKYGRDFKVKMLKANEGFIQRHDLFGADFKPSINPGAWKTYAELFDEFLMCKNYNGLYQITDIEQIALDMLQSEKEKSQLNRQMYLAHKKSKSIKQDSVEPYEDWVKKNAGSIQKLIILLSQERIRIPKKLVVNRDYNLITSFSNSALSILFDVFGLTCVEVDIKSCNPQILYLLIGLGRLLENFYGINKEHKRRINILLNTLWHDKDAKSEKKHQKQNKIRALQNMGFPNVLIDYLMENYFEAKSKGQLAHDLAYHEMEIVKQAKKAILDITPDASLGMVRKHDALLIIEPKFDPRPVLDTLTYYGLDKLFRFELVGSKFESIDHYFAPDTTRNKCEKPELARCTGDESTHHPSLINKSGGERTFNATKWQSIRDLPPSSIGHFLFKCRLDIRFNGEERVQFSRTKEILAKSIDAIALPTESDKRLTVSLGEIIGFKQIGMSAHQVNTS